jgi:hypothetical protein
MQHASILADMRRLIAVRDRASVQRGQLSPRVITFGLTVSLILCGGIPLSSKAAPETEVEVQAAAEVQRGLKEFLKDQVASPVPLDSLRK